MIDQPQKNARKKNHQVLHGSSSSLTALFILALIAMWMLSGEIVIGGSDTDKVPPIKPVASNQTTTAKGAASQKPASPHNKKLFKVRARIFKSRPRKEILHIRARSEADIDVEVRAETSARVVKIIGRKGALVKKGAILCKLDEGARRATLSQAQALVTQTKSDFRASAKLARRGFSATLNVKAKKAALDGAMAALKRAKIDLEYTSVRAPFTGIIEDQSAKVGDYLTILTAGKTCARLVKLHPLLIVGEVSERNINKLRVGQVGRAELVTGEKVSGKIRFISTSAKVATRTFRVELEVANKNRRMRNGVTADIYIPLKASKGHLISPALLTLNDAGDIGVRTVGQDNIVRFIAIQILEQGKRGVWITGLPKTVRIITVGQDYVIEGQKVEVIMEKAPQTVKRGAKNNERS